ncbi:hypothetical protein Ferp_0479 [Ferroglobus placidus DSM 10642]|uniref:Uncharacterized protein n=1 Tax=Ferroglobus placidus (strain DSM 10642 / AEDII12DO) TaxID=589924 RepID=D3S320_FERPA|nr:hypothetical protein [Ferroglobus placidus]ADC64653.1 hypothetical protein Ferp_0479 [Ferroglobus placidus DSM 10642]
MRVVFSFSVTDEELVQKIMAFKETGNLSALVNKLLRAYFDNNGRVDFENVVSLGNLQNSRNIHNEFAEYRGKLEELESRIVKLERKIYGESGESRQCSNVEGRGSGESISSANSTTETATEIAETEEKSKPVRRFKVVFEDASREG